MKASRTHLPTQVREGLHGDEGSHTAPHRRPHQGRRRGGRQQRQAPHPQQHHLQQGLHAAGPNAAVVHGLQAPLRPRRQAIGGVHRPVEMQTAAQGDPQGQHQRDLGQRPGRRQAEPQQRFSRTDHRPHPGSEPGDALQPRRDPWGQGQHAVEDPGTRQIRQPGATAMGHGHGQQRWDHRILPPRRCLRLRSRPAARAPGPAAAASTPPMGWSPRRGSCPWAPWPR